MTSSRRAFGRGALRSELLVAVVAAALITGGVGVIVYGIWHGSRPRPADFLSDVSPIPPTDPKLIVCQEAGGGFATGFAESRALAFGPDDLLHVSGDSAVRAFDPNGKQVREIQVPGSPGPLAVAPDGALYVGVGGRVAIFGPSGERQGEWEPVGPNSLLTSLAVTDSEVFVADAGLREVRRYDRSGKLLKTIGRKDARHNVPGFVIPSPYFDLAMAPDGLLRVVNPGQRDGRIEAYTVDGDLEKAWGGYAVGPEGFSGCCNPSNIALFGVDRSSGRFGGFITAEKGKGANRVKLHDATGKLIGIVAGPESFRRHDQVLSGSPAGKPFQALDVAVDSRGRIAILDPLTNRVRFFRRTRPQGAVK